MVALALFNDMLQLTMLLPIISTLVASPPPLGVSSHREIALGVFFAAKDICQLSVAPFAGLLTARTTPEIALALSTVGLGAATLVFARAVTFRQLLVARGCQGAASAAVLCGGLSLIAETHARPEHRRGAAMGAAYTGLALGVLCGPLVGGLLFHRMGRKKTFQLAAAVVLANAGAQLALMTLAPATKHAKEVRDTGSIELEKKKSFRTLLVNRDVRAVVAATVLVNAVVGFIKPVSQVILDKEFHIEMVARSCIITIATATYLLGTPLAGKLGERVPRAKLLTASLVAMSLATVFLSLARVGGGRLWLFNVCVGLIGIGLAFSGSVGQALMADLVDRHDLGHYSLAFALTDMADSLGLIVGPILGLAITQRFGASVGALFLGGCCLLLIPAVLRIQ